MPGSAALLCLLFLHQVFSQTAVSFNNFADNTPANNNPRCPACPDCPTCSTCPLGQEVRNKHRVAGFLVRALKSPPELEPEDLPVREFLREDWVDHTTGNPGGNRASWLVLNGEIFEGTGAKLTPYRWAAEGNLVFQQEKVVYTNAPNFPNVHAMDLWLLDDEGRAVQRWDAVDFYFSDDQINPNFDLVSFYSTTPSVTQRNKKLGLEWIEAYNRKQAERVGERLAPDFVGRPTGGLYQNNITKFDRNFVINGVRTLPPGWVFTISNVLAEGDLVVIHGQITTALEDCGVYLPRMNGAIWLLRFDDGLIVEMWAPDPVASPRLNVVPMASGGTYCCPFSCAELRQQAAARAAAGSR